MAEGISISSTCLIKLNKRIPFVRHNKHVIIVHRSLRPEKVRREPSDPLNTVSSTAVVLSQSGEGCYLSICSSVVSTHPTPLTVMRHGSAEIYDTTIFSMLTGSSISLWKHLLGMVSTLGRRSISSRKQMLERLINTPRNSNFLQIFAITECSFSNVSQYTVLCEGDMIQR